MRKNSSGHCVGVRRLLDAFKKIKKKLMSSLCTEFPTVDIVA